MKNPLTFTEECNILLRSINKPLTGDMARLAHRLSEATNRLDAIIGQANAQFRAGGGHATFNKQTIEAIDSPLSAGPVGMEILRD